VKELLLPVPDAWPDVVKSAVVNTVSVAFSSIANLNWRLAWCQNPRLLYKADADRFENELARLKEVHRITMERMKRATPQQRPRYTPCERMAIMEMKAINGWSNAETARQFLLEPDTISDWQQRLDAGDGLVMLPNPVNKYPEYLAYIVQRLQTYCPTLGKKKIADILARAGLHLAVSTIGRMKQKMFPPKPKHVPNPDETNDEKELKINAKRPDHTWHIDLTEVPIGKGFWIAWPPNAIPQCWPFCWWVAAVVDHYSRTALGFMVFRGQPSARQITDFLDAIVKKAGKPPDHIISDQGRQFDSNEYRDWCGRQGSGTGYRYGAVGKYGSIAVIERFFRSMKDECTRRIIVPLDIEKMRVELDLYFIWYNQFRTHEYLDGRIPEEAYRNLAPANRKPRFEPRKEWPRKSRCAAPQALVKGQPGADVELELAFLEGRDHLPIIRMKKAA
jgi:transposase InsO family protein